MEILIPKRHASIQKPLFFLAGPIRGGGDWQATMYSLLEKEGQTRGRDGCVASPCRWSEDHPLVNHFIPKDPNDTRFARQLDWERHYLTQAGIGEDLGCVVFWLPCESKTAPHPGPEPYAMDTRGELGEWRMAMKQSGARVVIGAEEGFLGLSQIQRNFSQTLGYEFPIYDTMWKTSRAAANLAWGTR